MANGAWTKANQAEMLDVTESLAFVNVDALFTVKDWGCVEGQALPAWAAAG
ncbi:hypothetical protein [Aureimonas sp. AU22]|uniref:hypothetical protein n=1 Tax=Aureimonas sp. AU22 TaxID=1638162 RepID=UPI00070641FF|nr:hypothetical protein [Aureimonas sp. AU22]BAT29860.1 succinate-semialdehyde dehydrogenase [Aureimonas sp. AU22]